ncbi:unnamed protein product [Cunninghamella blakesleeana]
MFKGVLAPVMGLAGLNAILFVSYGGILRYLQPNVETVPSLTQVYIAGCGAGMACFLFSTPSDLIKIKAQMSKIDKSSWEVSKEVFYRNGIKGFYQGGWITLIRDAPSYGIYFWVYEGMKRYLEIEKESNSQQAWRYLLAGGLAGTISWTSIYPLDVVKSRLQMQMIPTTTKITNQQLPTSSSINNDIRNTLQPLNQKPHYTSIKDCVVRSYQSDGIRVFFRGLLPTVLRGFPVNAVTFWVYEVVMVWLSTK